MTITPTNNLAKLGIAAAHAMRLELADQLFSPIAVNILNPAQAMMGGPIGNRGNVPVRLNDVGSGGNTGGFSADFNALEGDPVSIIKTMTSDGPIFTVQKYDGTGVIPVEDPSLGPTAPFSTMARYIVKADGVIYDLLSLQATDVVTANPGATGPYRHWQINGPTTGSTLGTYNGPTNTYTPPAATAITAANYNRAVGRISFRPKEGASAAVIQENLGRAQSTLDLMSRLLRSLHDESKGPFSNIVVR